MRNSKDILVVTQNRIAVQMDEMLQCSESEYTITSDIAVALDLLEEKYRLVVLDLELSQVLCREFLRAIYSYYYQTRVLIICRDAGSLLEMDLPKSYFQDFITEPINPEELISRIKFQLFECKSERTLNCGNTILNLGAAQMSTEKRTVDLSRYEQELARVLFENRNNLVSRETILSRVSHLDSVGTLRSVDIRICVLRKKLRSIHSNLSIVSKRNLGYSLIFDE